MTISPELLGNLKDDRTTRLNSAGDIVRPLESVRSDQEIRRLLANSKYFYVSVDIETDGPFPGKDYSGYSMLQLACIGLVAPNIGESPAFDCHLSPISRIHDKAAMRVANLSPESLKDPRRTNPAQAIVDLTAWVTKNASDKSPMLVSDCPSFDPVFIRYYLENFGGKAAKSLFAFKNIDLPGITKGMYGSMKARGSSFRRLEHTHDALDDARGNANWFIALLRQGFDVE